jgi:hypothetical protein
MAYLWWPLYDQLMHAKVNFATWWIMFVRAWLCATCFAQICARTCVIRKLELRERGKTHGLVLGVCDSSSWFAASAKFMML